MLRGGIYHQYQQQLQKLLNDNGFVGDLPSSFYPSIPPGSELMKWLVTSLDNSNFVQPADVALAAEYGKARQALEQDRADLLALTADQGLRQDGSEPSHIAQHEGEWLSSQVAEEDEAVLQELQQEHALMRAQLQEMQALERSLDAAQQAQRVQQQHADAAAMRDAKILSTEVAGLSQLSDKLNAQLEGLHNIVKEMHQLITAHGRRWLLLASNMEAYMDEDKRFVDTILQYTATTSSSEGGIQANGALSKHAAAVPGANSCALDEHAMKELKRLRMAFYLSEMEYVQAKARLAGAQAMASELESMVGAGQNGSSAAPWLDESARAQLAARVRSLEQQHEKIMQQEVPILVTELAQLQDTYVFQDDCFGTKFGMGIQHGGLKGLGVENWECASVWVPDGGNVLIFQGSMHARCGSMLKVKCTE
ncbi:hypothetical protein DUNSADRAFT_8990 [Dunaliella salina]|uniref:HAUS augmin-like complex subunit 3 N-terminal domain-containing protein n=1 Tax=Dunaliella salina TaxID=3046 RepID=A0ABQ7GIC7_DUNSA|nr:hypothetical protein DUNSADRAFT_8990 [Dunaliella salina]|eukprot:KAF5834367.1 hypothetical protein DUNSADRAFT_8990 [Dunaliella salina]